MRPDRRSGHAALVCWQGIACIGGGAGRDDLAQRVRLRTREVRDIKGGWAMCLRGPVLRRTAIQR